MNRISTSICSFNKKTKTLIVASEFFGGGFPGVIEVESHHTHRVVKFAPVKPGHPLFDEDQWDGEQCVYAPEQALPNCNALVVHHEW